MYICNYSNIRLYSSGLIFFHIVRGILEILLIECYKQLVLMSLSRKKQSVVRKMFGNKDSMYCQQQLLELNQSFFLRLFIWKDKTNYFTYSMQLDHEDNLATKAMGRV